MYGNLKKLLSLLLAVLFVAALIPSAFAENGTSGEEELPAGINGMPDDYELSEQQMNSKRALIGHNVLDALDNMTAGTDYAADQLIATADSEALAEAIAKAYNAELVRFDGHVAVLRISGVSVRSAVAAGLNPAFNLPPVEPNYRSAPDPVLTSSKKRNESGSGGVVLPTLQSWKTWYESSENPDPLMSCPNDAWYYQYQHDVVNSYEAWGVNRGWGHSVCVAVLDSGVDYRHEDLEYVLPGKDFVDGDDDPMDEHGHGTHCAGIIGATADNGLGGAGIAPFVDILPVRVLDAENFGWYSDWASGIYYAVDYRLDNGFNEKVDIISMSLCGYGYSTVLQDAVDYAYQNGVTVIAAMGNDGTNVKVYPAALDHVIAVAATDETGARAPFSNYGSWCDLAAPGYAIWSTLPESLWGERYGCWDGTSMAAPIVSGVAALYIGRMGNPGPAQLQKILLAATSKCTSQGCGKGIIDAGKLFLSDKKAPSVILYTPPQTDSEGVVLGSAVAEATQEGKLKFVMHNSGGYDGDDITAAFVYTLDGSAPSVANGELRNGQLLENLEDRAVISLKDPSLNLHVGDVLTVKVMCVSGMGVSSGVTTVKVKIVPDQSADVLNRLTVSVTAPKSLIPGKSIQLSAVVTADGSTDVDQKVTWKIHSQIGCPNAKIDLNSGKLTTKAGETGSITVRATSAANTAKYKDVAIQIRQLLPISVIKLNATALSLYIDRSETLNIKELKDSQKNDVNVEDAAFRWTSSNKKVAVVSETGTVTAVGKGSATITCEVLDGSGKKATCKVSVLQPATGVVITTTQSCAASGASVSFRADVLPKTASNRKVVWSLSDAPEGVTVAANGTVKIPATVKSGTFTIVAKAFDGVNADAQASKTVTILPAKAASIQIQGYADFGGPSVTERNGTVTAATLFSVPLDLSPDANTIRLIASVSNGAEVLWTSSNPKAAAVDPKTGLVKAVRAGTANISCTVQDGSNKKASCKITVVNPVSRITIQSKNPAYLEQNGVYLIGIGKTVGNTAVFADSYGKPSNTKVVWDFSVMSSSQGNITEEAKQNGWVKISKNGALTVNKGILPIFLQDVGGDPDEGDLHIYVYATATDGTGVFGYADYIVTNPVTRVSASDTKITLKKDQSTHVLITCEGGFTGFGYRRNHYTFSSSNPDIAYATVDGYDVCDPFLCICAGTKTGTAKITVKSTDGSNRTVVITVKVEN